MPPPLAVLLSGAPAVTAVTVPFTIPLAAVIVNTVVEVMLATTAVVPVLPVPAVDVIDCPAISPVVEPVDNVTVPAVPQ